MRELSDMMGESFEARARAVEGLGAAGPDVSGLARRVRRRRAVRQVTRVAVSLPVVAAVAVGGWWLFGQREPVVPVDTPSPTVSPSPSPSSTVVAPVALPDEPGLPPRFAPPEGILGRAGAGWVLATVAPAAYDGAAPVAVPEVEVVLLVDLEGIAYELLRRDPFADAPAGSWRELELLEWLPGSTTAVVRPVVTALDGGAPEAPELELLTLDLLTGGTTLAATAPAVTPSYLTAVGARRLFASPEEGLLGIVDASGTRTVEVGAAFWTVDVSPGGDLVLAGGRVVDLDDARVVGSLPWGGPAGWCSPVAWWTASAVLATCMDADPGVSFETTFLDLGARLVTIEVAELGAGTGTVLRTLGVGDALPWTWGGGTVSDRVVAVQLTVLTDGLSPAGDMCADGAGVVGAEETVVLASPDPRSEANLFLADAAGGRVVVESSPGCSGDAAPSGLSVYAGGSAPGTLVLAPPDDVPPGGGWWTQALTSWVLGS